MDQVLVLIEGQKYSVIGDTFWTMLECVKAVPGRTYEQKLWSLPLSLAEVQETLLPLQLVSEEKLLDAEVQDIQRVQQRLLAMHSQIEASISVLSAEVASYSRNSKSSIKASRAHSMRLLSYALEYAVSPVEKLAEPQVKTLYAALRFMEGGR